jgi:hypothetical protein
MTNVIKNVGYPILLAIGFLAFRFVLALAVSPLAGSLSAVSVNYLFWGVQIVALLLVSYWLCRKGERVATLVTVVLVLLSLGVGPTD